MSQARHIRASARRAFGHAAGLLAAAVWATLALQAPVEAAEKPAATPHATPSSLAPMRFVRVMSNGPACEPNCPEWISAEGKIVRGSAEALDRVVGALNGQPLPIFINSAGGSVEDAMEMGRLIRAKHLAVAVVHTKIAPCPASVSACGEARGEAETAGAYCASACVLVLAGGAERYVSPLSFVGVHQLTQVLRQETVKRAYKVRYFGVAWFKWEVSRKLVVDRSTSTIKRAADQNVVDIVAEYLSGMGVGEPVMSLTLATPSRQVRWLTPEELAASRLATTSVEGAAPVIDRQAPTGMGEDPIGAQSGAASLVAANSAPAAPVGLETTDSAFSSRRSGRSMLTTFQPSETEDGSAAAAQRSELLLALDPGADQARAAQFRAEAETSRRPASVAIPLRDFCGLAHGGRTAVSLAEPADAPPTLADSDGAKPLLGEACAPPAQTAKGDKSDDPARPSN